MAKLRHIAIAVPDVERSAQFYEKVFELERVGTTDSDLATGIYLSDGVISLALLNYKTDEAAGKERGKDYVGVHHVGFWVDDLDDMEKSIENGGGTFFLDLPEAKDSLYYEKKYRDPDGIIFDISHNGWVGASK
ncbi:MAG: VOC family protein [Alphaproteobacteria bacterium]|nr:VOC family protein [Alphaproteobacteria bacterium]